MVNNSLLHTLISVVLFMVSTILSVDLTNSSFVDENISDFGGKGYFLKTFSDPIPTNTKFIEFDITCQGYISIPGASQPPSPATSTDWQPAIPNWLQIGLGAGAMSNDQILHISVEKKLYDDGNGLKTFFDFIFEVRDSTGVLWTTRIFDALVDIAPLPESLRMILRLETDPLKITLNFFSLAHFSMYRYQFSYSPGTNYEKSLSTAGTLQVKFHEGQTGFPIMFVQNFTRSFIIDANTPLNPINPNYRWLTDIETYFLAKKTLLPDPDWDAVYEFDLVPKDFVFSSLTAADIAIGRTSTALATEYSLECVGLPGNRRCNYIRDLVDGSYYLLLNQHIQGLRIYDALEGNPLLQPAYLRASVTTAITQVIWFKLASEPGFHLCTKNHLMLIGGSFISFDLLGQIYVDEEEVTGMIITGDRWYSLAVSTFVEPGDLGVSATYSRIILIDIANSYQVTERLIESSSSLNGISNMVSAPSCGAEFFLRKMIYSRLPLSPMTPDASEPPLTACPQELPFLVYQRIVDGINKELKCLNDVLAAPTNPVMDPIIGLTREDVAVNCPDFWTTPELALGALITDPPSVCSCAPGTADLGNSVCGCAIPGQFYDVKRWFCIGCPKGMVPGVDGYSCEIIPVVESEYNFKFDMENKLISFEFNDIVPSIFTNPATQLKDYFFINVKELIKDEDYVYTLALASTTPTQTIITAKFNKITSLDYKTIELEVFSKNHKIIPKKGVLVTGPETKILTPFLSVTEKISPEAVQSTEVIILLGVIVFPSSLKGMPFIFNFFSFLRTVNFYPVKLPGNLHAFLKLFYIDYKETMGYKFIQPYLDKNTDLPLLKVSNREQIYIPKILYFSNTVPLMSFVSKIALIWYLIKWLKKAKNATMEEVKREQMKENKQSCIKKFSYLVFRKLMTFMLMKIHVYMYGRLVFIFAAFQGFNEIWTMNEILGAANIFEAIFDFTIIVWIELKIYDYLKKGSNNNKAQLMMLDLADLQSVLMLDTFKKEKNNSHGATYLCVMNLCLFILSSSLVVFQKFTELIFITHILTLLFMCFYTFISKKYFVRTTDYILYMINSCGLGMLVMLMSFFMYYTELDENTGSLLGFIMTCSIFILMLVKLVFFGIKSIRTFQNWKKRKQEEKSKTGLLSVGKKKNKLNMNTRRQSKSGSKKFRRSKQNSGKKKSSPENSDLSRLNQERRNSNRATPDPFVLRAGEFNDENQVPNINTHNKRKGSSKFVRNLLQPNPEFKSSRRMTLKMKKLGDRVTGGQKSQFKK